MKGKEGAETEWRRTPEVERAEEKSTGPKPNDERALGAPTTEAGDGKAVPTNENKVLHCCYLVTDGGLGDDKRPATEAGGTPTSTVTV